MYFFAILVLCIGSCTCMDKNKAVLELTDVNFHKQTTDREALLIMFHVPSCERCKRVKPEFQRAAEKLAKNDPLVALAEIDCARTGKAVCSKTNIDTFPTLVLYKKGQPFKNYTLPVTASSIEKYMKAQIEPSSKELKSIDQFKKFLGKQDSVSIVGFFVEESQLSKEFHKLADEMKETITFAHSSYEKLLRKEGIMDGVVLFRPERFHNIYEEDRITYTGKSVLAELKGFIWRNYHGLVGHRTPSNKGEFANPLVVVYYSVDPAKNQIEPVYWRNRILRVAKKYETEMNFAVSSKDDFEAELDAFGVDDYTGIKPIVLARSIDDKKYVMHGEFSAETVDKFVKNIVEGKLRPYVKSKPIPRLNTGPVTDVVAENFDQVVMNGNYDVLIMFYSPWCGHSQRLAVVYRQVGEALKNEDVAILKMDATENDVPPLFDVPTIPTVYWAGKNSKDKPILYEFGRELEDFIKFVAEHATKELVGYDRKGNSKLKKTEL